MYKEPVCSLHRSRARADFAFAEEIPASGLYKARVVSMTTGEQAGRGSERPLLPDELAKLPDAPASIQAPEDIAIRLAERRLYVAGLPG
jgi:hypothetical protein